MNENTTLEEFLISQSGLGEKPVTIWKELPNLDRLAEIRQELDDFLKKTDAELIAIQEEENARVESLRIEFIDKARKKKADLVRLLDEVGGWSPPNSFCEELKGTCMNRLHFQMRDMQTEADFDFVYALDPIIPADEYRAYVVKILENDIKSRERIIAGQIQHREHNAEMLKELKESIRPREDNRKVSP